MHQFTPKYLLYTIVSFLCGLLVSTIWPQVISLIFNILPNKSKFVIVGVDGACISCISDNRLVYSSGLVKWEKGVSMLRGFVTSGRGVKLVRIAKR